jgi:hypothetical protein
MLPALLLNRVSHHRYRFRCLDLTRNLELASHPHVLEVSVVARTHAKWGERPMAFVILHPQHRSRWNGRHNEFAEDLKKHAKTRLPGFACPEWVEVVQELPVRIFLSVPIPAHTCLTENIHWENHESRAKADCCEVMIHDGSN